MWCQPENGGDYPGQKFSLSVASGRVSVTPQLATARSGANEFGAFWHCPLPSIWLRTSDTPDTQDSFFRHQMDSADTECSTRHQILYRTPDTQPDTRYSTRHQILCQTLETRYSTRHQILYRTPNTVPNTVYYTR